MKPTAWNAGLIARNALDTTTFALAGIGIAIIGNATIWRALEGTALAERAAISFACAALVDSCLTRRGVGARLPIAITFSAVLVLTAMSIGRLIIGPDYVLGPDAQLQLFAQDRPGGSDVFPSLAIFLAPAVMAVFLRLPDKVRNKQIGIIGTALKLAIAVVASAFAGAGIGFLEGAVIDPSSARNMVQDGGALVGFVAGAIFGIGLFLAWLRSRTPDVLFGLVASGSLAIGLLAAKVYGYGAMLITPTVALLLAVGGMRLWWQRRVMHEQ